eukprot:TRINITY_DN17750_c0_g1_i1.p1 TRINITY_DN17750_c0_g1~~TRINITY_DN17750_c0_g1_i1.p1  ORF type:complete len:177 (-),score=37.18 TRINITY_DN17750_c0_g1_i1:134-664(-)
MQLTQTRSATSQLARLLAAVFVAATPARLDAGAVATPSAEATTGAASPPIVFSSLLRRRLGGAQDKVGGPTTRLGKPGGLGAPNPADDQVRSICAPLRESTQQMLQASGWNGVFTEFEPVSYSTQVVAGTNYYVKVRVAENTFVHVIIFVALPYTNKDPEVMKVKVANEADPLEPF